MKLVTYIIFSLISTCSLGQGNNEFIEQQFSSLENNPEIPLAMKETVDYYLASMKNSSGTEDSKKEKARLKAYDAFQEYLKYHTQYYQESINGKQFKQSSEQYVDSIMHRNNIYISPRLDKMLQERARLRKSAQKKP